MRLARLLPQAAPADSRSTVWQGRAAALAEGHVRADCLAGAHMLRRLAPHPRVVQPMGACGERLLLLTPVRWKPLLG